MFRLFFFPFSSSIMLSSSCCSSSCSSLSFSSIRMDFFLSSSSSCFLFSSSSSSLCLFASSVSCTSDVSPSFTALLVEVEVSFSSELADAAVSSFISSSSFFSFTYLLLFRLCCLFEEFPRPSSPSSSPLCSTFSFPCRLFVNPHKMQRNTNEY